MNGNVDPRIDKMVAYLYGELPAAEERAFKRLLEKDDALRAEFEELSDTRETLGGWKVEEHAPSFVLVENAEKRASRPRRATAPGWLAGIVEGFRSLAVTPAWGLAAAAALLLVLAVAGFRVEGVDGGVAFRFGDRPVDGEPTEPSGTELARTPPVESKGPPRGVDALPAGAYVTRKDLESYDADLMMTLAQLLNEYSAKRDREVTEGFQNLYQQVNADRVYDYKQLAGRIDLLGRELILENDRSARGLAEVRRNQPTGDRPLTNEEE